MNYLDERIIANVTLKYPSLGDRLYRYDVAINNEWESPVFIGNCFIGADVPTKAIDITDIVRNYYDFSYPYVDTEFQAEWQVRIWLDADELEHSYSDRIGIYPIYRYPNRKARMETPFSNNGVNWYMPALQGFNSDKKGEFLPHIPFVLSDKVDYSLAVNIGSLRDVNPYLYTGVKKRLETADFGIYNTQYKLSELWKGVEVETLDWDFTLLNEKISAYYEPTTGYYSFASLAPLSYKAYVYVAPVVIYDDKSSAAETPITSFPFVFDAENTGEQQDYPIDLYIKDADENDLLNIFPEVTKSCKATVHCEIKEAFENDVNLVENVDGGTKSGNFVTATTNATTFNVIAEDAEFGDVREETGLVTGKTFEWNDTEGIKTLKITTENGILCTISLADKSVADTGAEYLMQLQVAAGKLILSFLDQQYEVDVTFKTFRAPVAPLTQDNITIQNDGTDNLTVSNEVRFIQNKQDMEVVYGAQTISDATTAKKITTKLTNPTWSYAIVDKTDKLYTGTGIKAGVNTYAFALTEGDFIIYIFAISGANYEVTKITTKDFGIAKKFTANLAQPGLYLMKWNAALNDSAKYQQYAASKNIIEVAKVDACPARYYLQWRDRYGSMQMQPFCKVDTYSEDLTRTEIKNYQDNRRLSNISIQPKWKLNTKWLNNTVYPYYESLLVSPWIKMYDTKEDTVYDVIITSSDYTEKTFKNQSRQQFNLQIDVEAANTQNILY